jgi:predicted Zn-dependent peptidase
MAGTTASQVQDLAKKYLSTENTAIIVVGEAKQIQAELEKISKVIVYDQELQAK